MKSFLYTVTTRKSFEAAVDAVEAKTVEKGFHVVHTYDVAAAGFSRGPLKIIEVCNARFADEALKRDVNVALMLPCPIVVYTEGENTFISTMRPSGRACPHAHSSRLERVLDLPGVLHLHAPPAGLASRR